MRKRRHPVFIGYSQLCYVTYFRVMSHVNESRYIWASDDAYKRVLSRGACAIRAPSHSCGWIYLHTCIYVYIYIYVCVYTHSHIYREKEIRILTFWASARLASAAAARLRASPASVTALCRCASTALMASSAASHRVCSDRACSVAASACLRTSTIASTCADVSRINRLIDAISLCECEEARVWMRGYGVAASTPPLST